MTDAAKLKPLPFDKLLVDDSSRLTRNMADWLIVSDTMDEQYLCGLAEKVHHGPTRRGKNGRPAVSGVELQINEEPRSS